MDYFILRARRRAASSRRFRLVKIRRNLRDVSDPFQATTDAEFQRLFRLSKSVCRIFIDYIKPHMQPRIRIHGLNSTLRILCALRFLAVGCYQRPIGQDFFIAMSQTSVSRCVEEICHIVEDNLAREFVQFQITPSVITARKQEFYNLYHFPGVIGLIDGTHISIKKPSNDVEHVYYSSRKSSHTKNVQIICDANLLILNVNARYGGSSHDSFVWSTSLVKRKLRTEYENGNMNMWLLGDSGYALQPWLMTPLGSPSNAQEEAYNVSHKKTRHIVERCIGVLKSRFRCLSRQRVLMYTPQKAGLIINCCAILHNILITNGFPLPPEEEIAAEMEPSDAEGEDVDYNLDPARILSLGREIRNDVVRTFL